MTRRLGSSADIVIGCVVLLFSFVIGAIVVVVTASKTSTDNFLIGLAVLGVFMLTGVGFILKGIISKLIGGR